MQADQGHKSCHGRWTSTANTERLASEVRDRDVDTFHAHFRSERVFATGPGQITELLESVILDVPLL